MRDPEETKTWSPKSVGFDVCYISPHEAEKCPCVFPGSF